jgi:hypothetical protein
MRNGAEGEGVGIMKRVIHIPDAEYLRLDPLAALMRLHYHSSILIREMKNCLEYGYVDVEKASISISVAREAIGSQEHLRTGDSS